MSTKQSAPNLLSREYWNNTIKMSLTKFFILCVLQNRPMHGYELAKSVDTYTKGCCTPTEGTIYPVLKQFEAEGYVSCKNEVVLGRERKVYTITNKGREAFQVALSAWMNVTQCLERCRPMAQDASCCTDDSGDCELPHNGC